MVGLDYNYIDETGAKTSLDDVASNYELSKSQKEYLTELNVSPEEFKEMSDVKKKIFVMILGIDWKKSKFIVLWHKIRL